MRSHLRERREGGARGLPRANYQPQQIRSNEPTPRPCHSVAALAAEARRPPPPLPNKWAVDCCRFASTTVRGQSLKVIPSRVIVTAVGWRVRAAALSTGLASYTVLCCVWTSQSTPPPVFTDRKTFPVYAPLLLSTSVPSWRITRGKRRADEADRALCMRMLDSER